MSVEIRTSCDRPQAWATEAILSTTTLLMSLTTSDILRALIGAPVKHARQGDDLGEAERVGRGPLTRCLAVHAFGGCHERVGRFDAFDEEVSGAKMDAHLTGHPLLRGEQQRLDVTTHRIQELALVYEVAIRLRHRFLDALLAAREHELLELPVRGEQHLGSGRLECDAPLGPDDGIAEMNAAADAERRCERFQRLDERHGRERASVECHGAPLPELDDMRLRGTRLRERIAGQHPRVIRDVARRCQCLLAADRDTPETPVDGISCAEGRYREAPGLQVVELLLPLERAVAYGRQHVELRSQRAHRDLEAHLVITRSGAAVGNHVGAELTGHVRDRLRLHDALRAHAERIHLTSLHVAHDEEAQHLLEVIRARIDLVVVHGAKRSRTLRKRTGRGRIDSAGVDRDGDDGAAVVLLQPRHEKGGIETAGIGENDGLVALHGDGVGHAQTRKMACSRATRASCAPAWAVAMKMVSSPEMVPATSGHSARSMATATLCAAPIVVLTTVSDGPARLRPRTN